jgi:hypothetical protein
VRLLPSEGSADCGQRNIPEMDFSLLPSSDFLMPEVHLDRKLERVLTMLLRLKDLRRAAVEG